MSIGIHLTESTEARGYFRNYCETKLLMTKKFFSFSKQKANKIQKKFASEVSIREKRISTVDILLYAIDCSILSRGKKV